MTAARQKPNKILVVDVGGTHVKVRATGQREERKIPSDSARTPTRMVRGVKRIVKDWEYNVISIGYPGPVIHGRPVHDPHNLGGGWVGFERYCDTRLRGRSEP